jgi:uncharacterized protein (TIGR00730 family)
MFPGMRICVFCGSRSGRLPVYREAAERFGALLAREGIGLVYGGGAIGLMGAVADAAMAEGGEVIGVIPKALDKREIAHRRITELHVVSSMHERKAMMAELSDAFVALPGGIGTLEELFEVWTWAQLGLHVKACGLLDVRGFYGGLAQFIDHVLEEGFLKPEHRDVLIVERDPVALLGRIKSFRPAATPQWISPQDT